MTLGIRRLLRSRMSHATASLFVFYETDLAVMAVMPSPWSEASCLHTTTRALNPIFMVHIIK